MFCSKCGNEIGKDAEFCGKCGTKVLFSHQEDAGPSHNVATSTVTASENTFFLWKLKAGEYGLAKTYWLYGILIPTIVFILGSFIFTGASIYVLWGIYTVYMVFAFAGIYNSAEKYQGNKIWATLAKVAVFLGFIKLVLLWFSFLE